MLPPSDFTIRRRQFLKSTVAAASGMAGLGSFGLQSTLANESQTAESNTEYRGPNVIIVRFGGGVRRRETIAAETTYSPYFLHQLCQQGTLFPKMEISSEPGVETSHGQGTLNILTGIYDEYQDVENKFLASRFEAQVPTLFEYFRKSYNVAPHEALMINGEDRTDEEFYSFSNHHLFGVNYRCNVLSLYRFKTYLLRRQIETRMIADGDKPRKLGEKELTAKRAELKKLEDLDYREKLHDGQGREIHAFWEKWRGHYGETGLVNPRGDRLLTELSLWAMKELRPRLMMINYNDPDYVHWGKLHHYTRGVSIIDEGLKRLVTSVAADAFYRDNTIFAIVPDCGRDNNRFVDVPCQHHFNSKSSREIFALLMGPGIERGRVVDKPVQQISMAATIGQAMGMQTKFAQGDVLQEVFA